MARHSWLASASTALVIFALFVATGCAPATVTVAATATSTATPLPTTCKQLPEFANAAALSLPNMQFPDGTVARAPVTSGGGAGTFTISDYAACASHNTTDLVVATGKGPEAFTHLLLFYGWAPSKTFPFDAQFQTACGSAPCFVSAYMGNGDDPVTQHYLALKSVSATSTGIVTFHIFRAVPPAKPPCNVPIFDTSPHPYVTSFGNIPLPPLTIEGTSDGHAGSVTHYFCSAGTAATVSAFMARAIPMGGYTPDPSFGAGCWKTVSNGLTYRLCLGAITDPSDWAITTFAPM